MEDFDRAEQIWQKPLTRRQLMSAMTVGAGAMALVGCGDDDDDDDDGGHDDGGHDHGGTQASGQPKKGGSITLTNWAGPSLFDPHKSISIALGRNDVWGLTAATLMRYDWLKGTIYDGVAEKWEFPDPTTLVINLKKNVHFQQESAAKGREIDSSDVVASLERLRTKGDASFTIATRFNLVDTYEAVDKYTVRVKFSKPDANFLSWMYYPTAGGIIPKEAIELYGANMAVPEAGFSAGPFVPDWSTLKDTISVTLRRNPTYDIDPGGLPYLDSITVLGIVDASLRDAAFRTGQTDVGTLPALSSKQFESSHQVFSNENTITAVSQFDMNTEMAPFNDPRVRQAFHRAIDREELVQVVGDGFGCTSMILGCRSSLYLTEKDFAEKPGFRKDKAKDIEEAKKLLDAAGIDPKQLTLKFQHSPGSQFKVIYDMAVATKGILERNLGVKMNDFTDVPGYPTKEQMRAEGIQCNNHSDGGLAGMIWDDPLWKGTHSAGINTISLWNDAKTDELVEKQQNTLDLNERKKVWAELQRYLIDTSDGSKTLPFAPIVRNYDFWGAKKTLRNWTVPGYFLSQYPWQYNKVWLDE